MAITTDTNSKTLYVAGLPWQGKIVVFSWEDRLSPFSPFPWDCHHEIEIMYNYGVPTEILWCPKCGIMGDVPDD